MRSLSLHPNHYNKNFYFFFHSVLEKKMPSLSTKKRKAKSKADDLIYRKKFNLH